jgi:hypothetical protein
MMDAGTISIEGASANDSTRAVGDTARGTKNQTIAGAIKGWFREAVKAVTGRDEDEPQPVSRRRSGETDRGFAMAAKAALRRAVRVPADAYAAVTAYLSDTLDWLNLWESNAESSDDLDSEPVDTHTNCNSLRL